MVAKKNNLLIDLLILLNFKTLTQIKNSIRPLSLSLHHPPSSISSPAPTVPFERQVDLLSKQDGKWHELAAQSERNRTFIAEAGFPRAMNMKKWTMVTYTWAQVVPKSNVIKPRPVIDLVGAPDHRVIGRTSGSLVEPREPVYIKFVYFIKIKYECVCVYIYIHKIHFDIQQLKWHSGNVTFS